VITASIMKFLIQYPEDWILPLADWIDSITDWLIEEGEVLWDAISYVALNLVLQVESILMALPWAAWVVVLAVIGVLVGGPKLGIGLAIGLIFITVLGMWELAMITLALILVATVISIVVGIPVGILMAKNEVVNRMLRPVLDLMQTLPSFVYLIPVVMIFSIGRVPALLATFIYSVPPTIRLTNLGIRQVDEEVVEAGQSLGSTPLQLLTKIQFPLALPTIMAGINQTVMMALAMVVIASMIGAEGLGVEVLRGVGRLEVGRGFVGGISIVVLAVIIDRLTQEAVKTPEQE